MNSHTLKTLSYIHPTHTHTHTAPYSYRREASSFNTATSALKESLPGHTDLAAAFVQETKSVAAGGNRAV